MAPIAPRSTFAGTDAAVGFMWGASITACLILIGVCLRLVVIVSRRGKQRHRDSLKTKDRPSKYTQKVRPHASRSISATRPRDDLPLYEKIRQHKPKETQKKRKAPRAVTHTPSQDQCKILSLFSMHRAPRAGLRTTRPQHTYPSMQHANAGVCARPAPKPRAARVTATGRALWNGVFKEKRSSSFVSYDVLHKPLSRFSSKHSAKSTHPREGQKAAVEPTPYVANKHPGHFFEQYHVKPLHSPYLSSPAAPSRPIEAAPAPAKPVVEEASSAQTQLLAVPAQDRVHSRAQSRVQSRVQSLASSPETGGEQQDDHSGNESPKYPATASSRYSTIADVERFSFTSSIMPETPLPVVPPLHLMRFPGLPFGPTPPAPPTQSHRSLPISPPPTRALPILPSPPLSPFSHSDDECGTSRYTSVRTSSVFSLEPEDPTERYTLLLAHPPPTMAKTGKLPDGGLHIWMEEESLGY